MHLYTVTVSIPEQALPQ